MVCWKCWQLLSGVFTKLIALDGFTHTGVAHWVPKQQGVGWVYIDSLEEIAQVERRWSDSIHNLRLPRNGSDSPDLRHRPMDWPHTTTPAESATTIISAIPVLACDRVAETTLGNRRGTGSLSVATATVIETLSYTVLMSSVRRR